MGLIVLPGQTEASLGLDFPYPSSSKELPRRLLHHVPSGPMLVDGHLLDVRDDVLVHHQGAVAADDGRFRFTQIKAKYGSVRMYWTGRLSPEASALVEDAIDLAEARNACTCDVCGDTGVLRSGRWLTTRCDLHAQRLTPAGHIHIEGA